MKTDSRQLIETAFSLACDAMPALLGVRRLMLGCSAGGDSMAMLQLALRESARRDWQLVVAHFDHVQRRESASEARRVEALCKELGIKCITGKYKARKTSEHATEGNLRDARYAFFKKAFGRARADALMLAHQADDRAETFLMRLLAGSGPTGLSSIRPVEEMEGMLVLRPMLGLRREDLREYLRSLGETWREDPMNRDEKHKRVWVRRKIVPLFNKRIETDVTPRIIRACELLEEETSALDQAVELLLPRAAHPADPPAIGAFDLRCATWREAGLPLRRRLMRDWIWGLRSSPHPPGYQAVEEALKFAERGKGRTTLRSVERLQLYKAEGLLTAYRNERDLKRATESKRAVQSRKGSR